jgi:hypothetical protein
LILVYLLFSIYSASSKKQELAHAKNLINTISEIIGSSNVDFQVIPLITPEGWSIISYVDPKTKPNPCSGQNCLCICDSVSEWLSILKSTEERQLNECSKNGICLTVKNLKDFEVIEIGSTSNPTSINVTKTNGLVEVKKV